MRYHALVCDYDGTIAHAGRVDEQTLAALARVRQSGRKLILATGRQLTDLLRVFPSMDLFDRVVVENGAALYRPATREEVILGEPPQEKLVELLRKRNVAPLDVGRVIIATWEPNEKAVLDAIHELGLELQVVFNKGAVMVLPSGVNKATGVSCAFAELELSPHNAVSVGDAQNDHAMMALCECAVAVANALPLVKERADLVTGRTHGAGVVDLIDRLVSMDLRDLEPQLQRHNLTAGTTEQGEAVAFKVYGENLLIAGASGSGKSTLAYSLLERIQEQQYQFCIVDPEGDHLQVDNAITVGDVKSPPSAPEVVEILRKPGHNVVVNMLGIGLEDRPKFFQQLLAHLQNLRHATGRPHWIVIDEAHHLLPSSWTDAPAELLVDKGLMLITVHPDSVSHVVLSSVDNVMVVGESPAAAIRSLGETVGQSAPRLAPVRLKPGEALLWRRRTSNAPEVFRAQPPKAERQRHRRKYAAGDLGEDKSFYFQGPEGKLNLRAQNLSMFLQLGTGVDSDTWEHHLKRGDYSRWFRNAIKDEDLAKEAESIEQQAGLSAEESRAMFGTAISKRYTGAEK